MVMSNSGNLPIQGRVVGAALGGLTVLAYLVTSASGFRQLALLLVGFAAGISLYHSSFGFTAAWRHLLSERKTNGVRAQLIMIGVTTLFFFPALGQGSLFGQSASGFVNPVGFALALGAFLFGMGMQLGGGCASGTLFLAGGGSVRMLVTLAAFITGSLMATADPLGWMSWPDAGSHSAIELLGAPLALFVTVAILGVAYFALCRVEARKFGAVQPLLTSYKRPVFRGPWPLVYGALALALINVATLLLAGRPWAITSGFALWGAKAAMAFDPHVANWLYWQNKHELSASVFLDITSVMDFGIMLGALGSAGLMGRLAPFTRVGWRVLSASIIGGLLMGIGARLATGCNIGAFFSGVSSGSLHGLVWLLFALPGNFLGTRLRPLFRI
jgi:uncharacterized membrane protein YedE/YeeE